MDRSQTKREAREKAERLLGLLRDSDLLPWRIHVFHNTAWHYVVTNGYVSVRCSRYGDEAATYWAMVSDHENVSAAPAVWSGDNKHFEDPNDAVRYALGCAFGYVEHLKWAVLTGGKRAGLSYESKELHACVHFAKKVDREAG